MGVEIFGILVEQAFDIGFGRDGGRGSTAEPGEMKASTQFAARIERRRSGKSRDRSLPAGGCFAGPPEREPADRPGRSAVDRLLEKLGGRLELAGSRVTTRIIEAPIRDQVAGRAKSRLKII